MPKVSEEHRDLRRAQILAAAWNCFAHKGFHATSMAEIVAESGMSAGAVYLYFRSKEDLIAATASTAIGEARSVIGRLATEADPVPPSALLAHLLEGILRIHRASDDRLFRVAVEAWAEASRNETVGATARNVYRELHSGATALFRRWQGAGHRLPVPAADLARMVIGLVQGYIVQLTSFGGTDDLRYRSSLVAMVHAIEGT